MPSKPSNSPPPVPITNAQTDSPLFKLPPELRTKIWELVLKYNGCIEVPVDGHRDPRAAKEERLKAIPPPITRSCRLVRSETLPMFFGLNDFLFVTNYITPTGTFEEWLYTMRPHLSSMNYIFVLSSWIEVSLMSGTWSHRDIIARLYHDKHRNCWAVTSLDDWDDYDDHLRWDLECDSDLLQDILRQMMIQRSRADITAEFMLWLISDLMRIYYTPKPYLSILGSAAVNHALRTGSEILRKALRQTLLVRRTCTLPTWMRSSWDGRANGRITGIGITSILVCWYPGPAHRLAHFGHRIEYKRFSGDSEVFMGLCTKAAA
jgi:hypothetical protein